MEYEPGLTASELDSLGAILGPPVLPLRRIEGGQSATTDILQRGDGSLLVLRRHGRWSVGYDDAIADREAAVLAAVAAAGVPVPDVLWWGDFVSATAIATDYVAGEPVLAPQDPANWAEELADTLATIHSTPLSSELCELFRRAPPSPLELVAEPQLAHHPRATELQARLEALFPTRLPGSVLVHGDYWPGNLLWYGNSVAAVLDWEAATAGDPGCDVGYCYAELRYLGHDAAAARFVAAYRAITGRDLASLPYWVTMALCRAVREFDTYVAGWTGLGHTADAAVAAGRLDRLIGEVLDG